MSKDDFKFLANADASKVLAGNPDLQFSADQLQAIQSGNLQFAGSINDLKPFIKRRGAGCITWLRYEKDSDLVYMRVNGTGYGVWGPIRITNLNDFRNQLQNAMDNGHRITFCYNILTHKMTMLNVLPCGCDCKDD